MMRLARIVCIVFVLTGFLVTASPLYAQVNPYTIPATDVNVPKNVETLSISVMYGIVNSINCQLIGFNPTNPSQKCLGVNPKTGNIGFIENGGGAIGLTTHMISALYTPPATMSDYTGYLARNFGITKPAYAADPNSSFGLQGISPIFGIWKAFRDISYLLFVVVFIVIGFAIMLRLKIDPKVVMSIENQIPKIIVTLVMVTLSFGISAFLIDSMWYLTYVTINVLAQADPQKSIDAGKIDSKLQNSPIGFTNEVLKTAPGTGYSPADLESRVQGFGGGIIGLSVNGGGTVKDALITLGTPNDTMARILDFKNKDASFLEKAVAVATGNINALVKDVVIGVLVGIGGYLLGALGIVVFLIAILSALIRLWIALLYAFVFLLIDIMLAPVWFLSSLLPGSSFTIESWFREMLAELSAFMVAVVFIMLGRITMIGFSQLGQNPATIVPLIGSFGNPGILSALVGIGFILLTPQVVVMTKGIFKAPDFKFTKAIGEGIGVGTGMVGNVGGAIWKKATRVEHGHAIGALPTLLQGSSKQGSWRHSLTSRLFGTYVIPGGTRYS